MKKQFQIGVIIATSFRRTDLLFSRSLKSVLYQIQSPDFIVIVDDNQNENEFEIISQKATELNNSNIFCIRNSKIKHYSGTGAWNTGIDFLFNKFNDLQHSYIAILDDDDEWDKTYLEKCAQQVTMRGVKNTKAVFANLVRLHKDFEQKFNLKLDSLTIENFLIGNSGVQASNMFFRSLALKELNGFDETLKSCTDRDLMIRFLQQNSVENIAIIDEILVSHYAQSKNTVTNNCSSKWAGLDSFYNKYLHLFSVETLTKSLERAEGLFAYPNSGQVLSCYNNREKIVLTMPLRNGVGSIHRAILSIANQKNVKRKLILVIGNDNSTDNWQQEISDLLTENIIIVNISDGGKSYKVRNAINGYILQNLKNVAYIGRLDVDDELADELVIARLEEIIDKQNPDVIIAGNYQRKIDKIVGTNIPDKNLLDEKYLLERLRKMSRGIFEAELPSCNIFTKPDCLIKYPEKESAEDHWFMVELLLKLDKSKIYVAENLLYCIYSLDGSITKGNRKKNNYLQSRIDLFEYYLDKVKNKTLQNIRERWSEYIHSDGTSFHKTNIQKNKDKLISYWAIDCPINKILQNVIKTIKKTNIKLLDVGCGPFPKSGIYLDGYIIEITLVDALAKEYHLLLEENGINTNNQHIINCQAEMLEIQFTKNLFDVIFSKNALDHTYHPIKAIENMINLLSVNGIIVLIHFIEEGKHTNYFGLHQWNFSVKNGYFYISNENETINECINDLFPNTQIEIYQDNDKIITFIRK